jgi:carbamoyltransferase
LIILGISAYYHDSAAALIVNGEIIAAAQEERFTRIKQDKRFPISAIKYCLKEAGCELSEVDRIVFYDDPKKKFSRIIATFISYAPKGIMSFIKVIPSWLQWKLFIKHEIVKNLVKNFSINKKDIPAVTTIEHHRSHAASAFFPSPYKESAVLCIDGVGDWATTSAWVGEGNKLKRLWQINFPHSLGLLYSAFTYYCGFKVNSGEYKLMGLAPYGNPVYVNLIKENIIHINEDGTFSLDMSYFDYAVGSTMTSRNFDNLFGGSRRKPESKITQKEMDIACSIQIVTEEIVLKLSKKIQKDSGSDYLCLAGGVALNCVSNGRLVREGGYKGIWIQPAAGDAGGALGAALSVWYEEQNNSNSTTSETDDMHGSYLGGGFSNDQIREYLDKVGGVYSELDDIDLLPMAAKLISEGNVIGWFNGRMEFGPRALGARSILGDPRNKDMQSVMNLKIKYRESFRPFAPAVLEEEASEWFDLKEKSRYMLLVSNVNKKKLLDSDRKKDLIGLDRLNSPKSQIPAVTHVDNSARIQTVSKETNLRFYNLLKQFQNITGCPVLINTSFNVRGEPIVYTPEDAVQCFQRTEMDYLVIENFILSKEHWAHIVDDSWKDEYELD